WKHLREIVRAKTGDRLVLPVASDKRLVREALYLQPIDIGEATRDIGVAHVVLKTWVGTLRKHCPGPRTKRDRGDVRVADMGCIRTLKLSIVADRNGIGISNSARMQIITYAENVLCTAHSYRRTAGKAHNYIVLTITIEPSTTDHYIVR